MARREYKYRVYDLKGAARRMHVSPERLNAVLKEHGLDDKFMIKGDLPKELAVLVTLENELERRAEKLPPPPTKKQAERLLRRARAIKGSDINFSNQKDAFRILRTLDAYHISYLRNGHVSPEQKRQAIKEARQHLGLSPEARIEIAVQKLGDAIKFPFSESMRRQRKKLTDILVGLNIPALKKFARGYGEDVFCDLEDALLTSVNEYDPRKGEFSTLLYIALYRKRQKYLTKAYEHRTAHFHEEEGDNLKIEHIKSGDMTPEQISIEKEEAQRKNTFIEMLFGDIDEREREVIRLRFYEGLPLKETGRIMGLTGERVRQIQAYAFKKLRKDYADEYTKIHANKR